jgi:hypothetical protein
MTGTTLIRETIIENSGNTDLIVTNIALCEGTSNEFSWLPIKVPLILPAGTNFKFSATYAPVDKGADTGCLQISSNDPNNPVIKLSLWPNTALPFLPLLLDD